MSRVTNGNVHRLHLLVALVAAVLAVLAATAPGSRATTAPGYNFKITVTVTDNEVILSRSVAKRGWRAHFVIRNKGRQTHVLDVGGLKTKPLKPGASAKLGAYLDQRGQYPIKLDRKVRGFFTVV